MKYLNFKNLLQQIRAEGVSMRRRFVVYIISAIALVVCLILLLLNLFGVLNPANAQVEKLLDTQLQAYADNIADDYDKIAAYAISFSHQLEAAVQDYLTDNNLSFQELKDQPEALFSLQNQLYHTVYLNLQLAPSSGAFYILSTTVNSRSPSPLYNGLYLKYINLYSESTLNNSITLYRGSYTTGKKNGLTFHSGWQNEMQTDFFNHGDSLFPKGVHYILSPIVQIPDTWERSRYVYVPIRDLQNGIIGVCGFEVNDLYFQLSERSSDCVLGQLVGGLLDTQSGVCSGQFDASRYNNSPVQLSQTGDLTVFDFGEEKCIGKTKSVTLGSSTFYAALMLSQAQYNRYIFRGQLTVAGIISFVLLFAFAYCLFMSKKYVSPVLKKIEQIKANEAAESQLKIREIDDLFAFLAEKDTDYAAQLQELEKAKHTAEEEARRTREAYEKALAEYQLAQSEILQLSDERKKEIVLEDYEYFICNLKTLTPTEYRVYELYLAGQSAAQIAKTLGITENTLKYHNKNIYSKLGISSRKQLLRYAALKQHQDRTQEGQS